VCAPTHHRRSDGSPQSGLCAVPVAHHPRFRQPRVVSCCGSRAAGSCGHERRPYTSDKCLFLFFFSSFLLFFSYFFFLFFSFLFSPQGPVDVR
jgi:hypothetical protein